MQRDERGALVADRHDWLLDELARSRRVVTVEAAQALDVSVDSIRRDLRLLHDQGRLRRVHGGAVPISTVASSFRERTDAGSPERTRLADAIVERLRPGLVIGLDAGSTATEIAARLPRTLDITIVTNNPAAAVALADHPAATVELLGGAVDLRWMATTGPTTVDAIRAHHLDLAVVGVCGIDPVHGLTTRSPLEVHTKRAVIAAAAETLVVAESAKLGAVEPHVVAPATAAEVVVLDGALAEHELAEWRAAGVTIQTV